MSEQFDPFAGFSTIPEAARKANKAERTIKRYLRQGKLTRYKFGCTTYIKNEELTPRAAATPQPRRA